MGSIKVRSGQEIVWECGSIACIKKSNGKYILTVKNKKSALKNEHNKWIFKSEFDFVGRPDEKLVCDVIKDGKLAILNFTSGKIIEN